MLLCLSYKGLFIKTLCIEGKFEITPHPSPLQAFSCIYFICVRSFCLHQVLSMASGSVYRLESPDYLLSLPNSSNRFPIQSVQQHAYMFTDIRVQYIDYNIKIHHTVYCTHLTIYNLQFTVSAFKFTTF